MVYRIKLGSLCFDVEIEALGQSEQTSVTDLPTDKPAVQQNEVENPSTETDSEVQDVDLTPPVNEPPKDSEAVEQVDVTNIEPDLPAAQDVSTEQAEQIVPTVEDYPDTSDIGCDEPLTDLSSDEVHAVDPEASQAVQLSQNGEENRDLLNALLQTQNVLLVPGDYPVAPGVIVDSHTLDLGGARLTCTQAAYGGGLIILCGENPAVINGQLSGLYTAAAGEPGYLHVEYPDANGKQIPIDSTIKLPIGGFTNAMIDNVKLDHCHGYTICSGGENQIGCNYLIRHVSPKALPADGYCRFELTSNFAYVTARHAIGYNYQISDDLVSYVFRDAGLQILDSSEGVPGEAIKKPNDAKYVDVYVCKDTFVQFGLFEYAYDNSLTISNCDFWCNQRLGIVNLPGPSLVKNCTSRSNGYPREDHTGITWDSSTSGFMDIEDVQSPYLEVVNCSSTNENLGIASRAYNIVVRDSSASVSVYGGWRADVYNHEGRVAHATETVNTKIFVHDSKITNMWAARIGPNYEVENCTIELCSALNRIKNFVCDMDYPVTNCCVYLDGVLVGKLYGTTEGWYALGPKKGSDLEICSPDSDDSGPLSAISDCWGLHSNKLLLPNGHTIHDSTFKLTITKPEPRSGASIAGPLFNGTYENCIFEVHCDEPFISKALWFDAPTELSFIDCNFTADNGLALIKGGRGTGLVTGSILQFENCMLNGQPMTIEMAEQFAMHNSAGVEIICK